MILTERKVLILGALSGIAREVARRLSENGASLALVGRNKERLEREAGDLRTRGACQVHCFDRDLTDVADADEFLKHVSSEMGGLDTILLFYGYLGDQIRAEKEPAEASKILEVNFTSAVLWCLASGRFLEANSIDCGVLLCASSVAGDRGRRSNFLYGAAKGGLSTVMQGLAHKWERESPSLRAINLKFGFVDTPMTYGLKKGGPLWSNPVAVADIVLRKICSGSGQYYTPWFWRLIMLVVRLLPDAIFKRINF